MPGALRIDGVECSPNPINSSGGEIPMVTVMVTNTGDEPTTANVTASLQGGGGSASASDTIAPGVMSTMIMAFRTTDFGSMGPGSYPVTIGVEGGDSSQQSSCNFNVS